MYLKVSYARFVLSGVKLVLDLSFDPKPELKSSLNQRSYGHSLIATLQHKKNVSS